jgi:hypothetical protein
MDRPRRLPVPPVRSPADLGSQATRRAPSDASTSKTRDARPVRAG